MVILENMKNSYIERKDVLNIKHLKSKLKCEKVVKYCAKMMERMEFYLSQLNSKLIDDWNNYI